jgi:hypothetical protein
MGALLGERGKKSSKNGWKWTRAGPLVTTGCEALGTVRFDTRPPIRERGSRAIELVGLTSV